MGIRKKISIVTVVYNSKNLIRKTIESVINQTYFKNIEYIIVDGGSTDGTLDILKEYENKFDIFISEPDDGIYQAMNKSLKLANGEWINFMNAGDTFVNSNTVEEVFSQASLLEYDFIYGNSYYVKDSEKHIMKARPIEDYYACTPICHQSLFMKTEIMKKFPFNTKYSIVCDLNLYITCYIEGYKFKQIDQFISNYLAGGFSDQNLVKSQFEKMHIVFSNSSKQNIGKQKLLEHMLTDISPSIELLITEKQLKLNEIDNNLKDTQANLNKIKNELNLALHNKWYIFGQSPNKLRFKIACKYICKKIHIYPFILTLRNIFSSKNK